MRQALKCLPPPFANHHGVVPLPPSASSPSFTPVIREVHAASAALARLEALTSELGDPWLVSRILMRREAVSSSAIEGTNSTLDKLLAVEETGDTQAQDATRQVKDYALSLESALPQATSLGPSVFTAGLISELHRSVMKSKTGYSGIPGEPRTRVVWIGGRGDIAYSTYNPTPPDDIERCLADTIDYMRGDADELWPPHIIIRMAVAHAHFEAVHPFADGNGRVGRLLLLPLLTAAQGHAPLIRILI
nr:Fic/DOC family N-terminal domain-containing protein [uncultured Rhodopila sp.]